MCVCVLQDSATAHRVKSPGTDGLSETSVRNYHHSLRNSSENSSSQFHALLSEYCCENNKRGTWPPHSVDIDTCEYIVGNVKG